MQRLISYRLIASVIFYAGYTATLSADELEDALGAFEELSTTVVTAENKNDPSDNPYGYLTGNISLSASYNFRDHSSSNPDTGGTTNWQGLSKLRTKLYLEHNKTYNDNWQSRVSGYAFYDSMYSLRDRGDYSNSVLSEYEHEAEFQEVWILGKLRDNIDLKLGRQVVNWGRADSFRILDVLNPLDNREPGLVDIEDLRLPVAMAKLDYYFNEHWGSSFIVIPEVRFGKNPPPGSDYEVKDSEKFKEDEPENFSDSSYAASLSGIYSGWDVSFHIARYWRDAPYLEPVFNPGGDVADPNYPLIDSRLKHSRLTMIGGGGNYTKGAWLYKGEMAWIDGIDYTVYQNVGAPFNVVPTSSAERNRLDTLLGIEYFGIANTSFAVELAHQYIVDFDNSLEAPKPANEQKNTTGIAFRASHNMYNDRLDLNAVIFGTFNEGGSGVRFDAEYDLRDALALSGGVIFYEEGDYQPFDTYYKNDRLFGEIKYSF